MEFFFFFVGVFFSLSLSFFLPFFSSFSRSPFRPRSSLTSSFFLLLFFYLWTQQNDKKKQT